LNGSDVIDLIDYGSSNGTFVNGKKVQRHPVGAGDLIRLAGAEFRVVDTDVVEKAEEFHKAEIEFIKRELAIVRAERDEALEQNKTQSRELRSSSGDIETLEAKSERRSAELGKVREQNLQLESQIAALQFELKQRDGTIEKANRERDEARQRNEDWRISYEELTGQLTQKTEEHLESERDLRVSQEKLQFLIQKIGLLAEQLLNDWKDWFSDEEMPEGGESADDHLERVEAGRQKIREELNKIEPIWFEFGDIVQEELNRRCNDLKLKQRSLTKENRDKRKVLERTGKDLEEIRETVDEEIRRA
jgi:pSer/pThr/pTyr-binding forkhead associated (FHA) protein